MSNEQLAAFLALVVDKVMAGIFDVEQAMPEHMKRVEGNGSLLNPFYDSVPAMKPMYKVVDDLNKMIGDLKSQKG